MVKSTQPEEIIWMGKVWKIPHQNWVYTGKNLSQAILTLGGCEGIYLEPIALIGHDGF